MGTCAQAATPRDPDTVEARLRFRACAAAHREEGVALCREALARGLSRERAALAQLLLARDLGALERWDDALDAYRAAQRLRQGDPQAARRIGQVLLFALGRPAEAEAWLRQALAGQPADSDTRVDLAQALAALSRHDEALREFAAALEQDAQALADRPAAQAVLEAARQARPWP